MARAQRLIDLLALDPAVYAQAAEYEVLGLLGEGGMGRVLLARHIETRREVAVKLLLDDNPEATDARMRFHREARALAALDHPAILHVLAFSGSDCPRPFLITERLLGRSLHELVADRMLTEAQAAAVGHDLALGLAQAHRAGIVHRDVTPSNIVIEPSGRVVLIDFGLVKGTRDDDHTFAASQTKLVGTQDFVSPEQCTGSAGLSGGSDLFSLGSVLYYAASQVLPFRGETMLDVLQAIVDEPQIPLVDLTECSAAFSALLDGMLQKVPSERFASGTEVARLCVPFLNGQTPSALLYGLATEQPPAAVFGALTEVDTFVDTRIAILAPKEKTLVTRAAPVRRETLVTRVQQPVTRRIAARVDTNTRVITARTVRPTPAPEASRRWVLPTLIFAGTLVAGLAIAFFAAKESEPPVIIATTPTLEQPPPPLGAVPVATGTVRLGVKPWGQVFVDGVLRGNAPELHLLELPLGAHHLEVRHPTLGSRMQDIVLTRAGEEILARFDLQAK